MVIGHPNWDGEEAIFQYVESMDERGEQEGKFVMETEERTSENEWFYKIENLSEKDAVQVAT